MTENNEREASVRSLAEKLLLYRNDVTEAIRLAEQFHEAFEARQRNLCAPEMPLSELNLSVRSLNALHRQKIGTVRDLARYTIQDLKYFQNGGDVSRQEIAARMADIGYPMREA